MRLRNCLLTVLLLTGIAFGQGSIYSSGGPSVSSSGVPIFSLVTVCTFGATGGFGIPCSPQAVVYPPGDIALTPPVLTQPFQTDNQGNYAFACTPGQYKVQLNVNGVLSQLYPVNCGGAGGTGSVNNVIGTANQITSSGGTNPTLSFPSLVVFPNAASVPNLTSTTLNSGSISTGSLGTIQFADTQVGSNCGAKINAALANVATGGTVIVNQNCVAGGGVISTPVLCTGSQVIQFLPGFYPYSAQWNLGGKCTVQGPPSAINEDILIPLSDPAVVLQQVAGSNLAPSFLISGPNVVLQDFAIDLNQRGGNTSGTGIDFNTAACSTASCLGHFRMYRMTVENGPIDNVHITSSGTADQANAWIIENSAITRAGQTGLTVTNSTDGRLLYNNLEENFAYGIREIDSGINAIGNDISTGSTCVYITGDGNGADVQLAGGGDIYAYNACVPTENASVSASLFGGFVVQGYNGTAAPAIQNERFIGNTIVAGQGFINNTLDAIHMEDAGAAEITDNYFLSFPGQSWRYNVYIAYNHSGGQRDTVVQNEFSGNIGTGFATSNGSLYLQGNNEAGNQTSTLQDAAIPNFNGSNAGGLFCKTASGANDICLFMDSLNILELKGDPVEAEIVLKPDGTTQSLTVTPTSVVIGGGTGAGIGSGVSTNTDLVGFKTLSAATTITQGFTGTYANHPECTLEPQFDIGSGNRHWVTYTGVVSFTMNFAAAVTGSVSYHCLFKN